MTSSAWQPIATAPVDGTRVILFDSRVGVVFGCFIDRQTFAYGKEIRSTKSWSREAAFLSGGEFDPTHWMPLPDVPANPISPHIASEVVS